MSGARCPEAWSAVQTTRRRVLPPAAHTGGQQRPPEDTTLPTQVGQLFAYGKVPSLCGQRLPIEDC